MADAMAAHRPESVLEPQFVFRLVVGRHRPNHHGDGATGDAVAPEQDRASLHIDEIVWETRSMIRDATRSDAPSIRALMQMVSGFWQSWWSEETIADAIQSANRLAFVSSRSPWLNLRFARHPGAIAL